MSRAANIADAFLAGIAPACEYHRDEPAALQEAAGRIHRRFLPTGAEVNEAASILSNRLGVNIASFLASDIAACAHDPRFNQRELERRWIVTIAYAVSLAKDARVQDARRGE